MQNDEVEVLSLTNKIALVTGASRGIGKGIAQALSKAGAAVYITGRTVGENTSPAKLSGSITQTSAEINATGGRCVPIQCDHTDDDQVAMVFNRIQQEHGKLDVLVNNVWGGYEFYTDGTVFWNEVGFWEAPFSRWDSMFQSGVRAHYISSVYAAQLMIPNQSGLIVNLSFFAAQRADKGVAYGAAKAATDHMNSCMAHELKPNNIAALCIYPGLVRTEAVLRGADHLDLTNSESPQFIGRAVVALAEDENCMAKSGTVCIAAELALEYGFIDIDGSQPKPLSAMDI